MHFVIYLEFLEALSYREQGLSMDTYQIPHLIVTRNGFTLKDIEFDAQHNKELLIDTIQLKTDTLTLIDIQPMADELVYYLVLFNVRKRSAKGLYQFSQGFPLYKAYKSKLLNEDTPYVNVKFSDVQEGDWDLIESLMMYDDSLILDTPIYYIDNVSVLIINYPHTEIHKTHHDTVQQVIQSHAHIIEPYVFNYDEPSDTITFNEDISGL